MSKQDNIEAQQYLVQAASSGNLAAFHEVLSPTIIDHDPAPGQARGAQGCIAFFAMLRTAFPDMELAVEHMVADDDSVAFAYTLTGTHQGDFMNIPGTGKPIKVRGIQISRFEHGRMIERWGSTDELGILKQITHAVLD